MLRFEIYRSNDVGWELSIDCKNYDDTLFWISAGTTKDDLE